jgi:multimeric flavodoxin WrbA
MICAKERVTSMEVRQKIVVITGSPRKNGNSFALAKAFIGAAEASGHTIERFDAADMEIRGCTACETCYQTGKACSFDDDFDDVAPVLETADVVVFITPLYWYTFPAKIKAVIDKLYALYIGKRGIGNKKCALIVCCEGEAEPMEGIVFSYKHTMELMEWESVGEVLIPLVHEPGDIAKTDGLSQVIALAEML